MTDFHLDHQVALDIAAALRARGHDVVTARELHLETASDAEHLLAVANNGRVLVTHNGTDFRVLQAAWRHWTRAWGLTVRHVGILVVAQQPHLTPQRAARQIDHLCGLRSIADELYALEPKDRTEYGPIPGTAWFRFRY